MDDVSERYRHVPVLLGRVLELLAPALTAPGAVVVDATLGMGGHAEALLVAHPQARLIGIDRDTDALALATARLAPFETRITLVHAVYDQLPVVLAELGLTAVDGILFDLGVSSLQLDETERVPREMVGVQSVEGELVRGAGFVEPLAGELAIAAREVVERASACIRRDRRRPHHHQLRQHQCRKRRAIGQPGQCHRLQRRQQRADHVGWRHADRQSRHRLRAADAGAVRR